MAQLLSLKSRIGGHVSRPYRTKGPHMVINLAPFFGVQAPAPVWRDEDNRLELRMVSRLKEILREEYPHDALPSDIRKALWELKQRFTQRLQIMPYRQLVEEGYVNQLLDDYLGLLLIADEAQGAGYLDEREYYYHRPQAIKDIALHLKYLVIEQH